MNQETVSPFSLPARYAVREIISGLQKPTQFVYGTDGRLLIAQLFTSEGAAQGQIITVDPTSGEQELLLGNLDKPTGLAVLNDALWVATQDQLLRAPLDAAGYPGVVEVVLDNLPNNGRSNGTLTVTPDGLLLFATSGRRQGNEAAPRSGILWQLDPADPQNPTPLATGLKNGYAHAFDVNGRLWSTEIGDGTVTGPEYDGQPPEELNEIIPNANYGWPRCFGNQKPALNREGTAAFCAETRPPLATFPPQMTPTSVVLSPFDPTSLLVALWVGGEVVNVSIVDGSVTPFASGLPHPQHLLPTPSGTLLLSDYQTGVIYEIIEVKD